MKTKIWANIVISMAERERLCGQKQNAKKQEPNEHTEDLRVCTERNT